MSIGDIIKTKREELGMTQQEIADKLFVSRQTVSRWESGSRCPDLITAKKIANVLGITVDDLVPSEDLANYTPVKDKPPVLNKMLAALFLLGLSIWLLVFSAASNETFLAVDKGVFTVPDKAARTVYYACKETILAAVDGAFPNTRPPAGSYKAQGGETMSDQEPEHKRSTPVRTSV